MPRSRTCDSEDRIASGILPTPNCSVLPSETRPAACVGDAARDVVEFRRRQFQWRPCRGDAPMQHDIRRPVRAKSPGRVRIDFRDHHAGAARGIDDIVVGQAGAEPAIFIFGQLDQHHIGAMPAMGKIGTKCAVVARDHVELLCLGQRAGVADHAVALKHDPGGSFRRKRIGKYRTHDHGERRQSVFLRDQRLGQRARLGGRLPAHHDIASPNDAGKVERCRSSWLARHDRIRSASEYRAPPRDAINRTWAGRAPSRR